MGNIKKKTTLKDITFCGLFAALISVGGFIKIPIPNIPFTLQFLCTSLAGLLLGSKRGCYSVVAYIFIGLCGIPVFAQGGGPTYIFSPTFGYLVGFAVATYVVGYIIERTNEISYLKLLTVNIVGMLIMYFLGLTYFYIILRFYTQTFNGLWIIFLYGFFIPLPGDIFICIVSSFVSKKLIPVFRRQSYLSLKNGISNN